MTVLATFAYGLIVFGPIGALFCTTVAFQPYEVIISIAGSFFWLLSLFCSSVIWAVVPPLQNTPAFTLPFSVLLQELFRFLLFKLLQRADHLLAIMSDDKTARRKLKVSYVGGMGFALIVGLVYYGNVLSEAGGPGVVGLTTPKDSTLFFLTSALGTVAIMILHVCWGVMLFHALDTKNWVELVVTILLHMAVACLSLANRYAGTTVPFLVISYAVVLGCVLYCLFIAGMRPHTAKYLFVKSS